MNDYLLSTVRFYFAQSVFMNNCHYKAYGRIEKRKNVVSNIVLTFSAITIGLLIFQVIGLENDSKKILTVVAYVGLLLTGSSLVFELINKEDLSILMYQHQNAAEKYKTLRDEYMGLIEEILTNNTDDNMLRAKRDQLQQRYSALGEYAPTTNYEDYVNTQKGLGLSGNSDEEFTWGNDEIDKLLPQGHWYP